MLGETPQSTDLLYQEQLVWTASSRKLCICQRFPKNNRKMCSFLANKYREHIIVTVQFDGSWSHLFDRKPMVINVLQYNITSSRKKTGTILLAGNYGNCLLDTGGCILAIFYLQGKP
jgi:hypothetical protein